MGKRAAAFEAATDAEIGEMARLAKEAIRAGALGFTTSRSQHHETSDNRPVASRLASWDEVVQLVHVMGSVGSGIFEGTDGAMAAPDPEERSRALARMRVLASESHVPITFGLVATRSSGYLLDFLDEAAAAGGRVIAQTHCRGISVLLSLKTKLPFDLLPSWHDLGRNF